MPEKSSPFAFLRSKPALAVTGLLAAEILLFYALPTKEYVPTPPPLDVFSRIVGPWTMTHEYPIAPDAEEILKADDTLTRDYTGPAPVSLFVAFFKSQRAGVVPHSPKLCLPANGWSEESSRIINVDVPGARAPIPVNRYVVEKDDQRELVLYWFQNWHRATADEYMSRFYLLYDSVRYHRSDEALVRIVTLFNGDGDKAAEANAIHFLKDVYEPLKQQIWSGPTNAAAILP
ncbi:MAG TPA: EpsI family protein [Bryobacteraceae bacterium]|jgi:EpsI family protein|nr:EpsI family protein [Bryobacteraceae bacterium]